MSLEAEIHKSLMSSRGDLGLLYRITIFLLTFSSISVLVISRRNFGERKIYFPLLLIQFIIMMMVGSGVSSISKSYALPIYGVIFLAFGIYHLWVISKRRKRNERWHSRYDGDVCPLFYYLRGGNNEYNIRVWYEPIAITIIGLISMIFSPILGILMCYAGASSAILSRISFAIATNAYLDQVDAQIEADQMQSSLAGEPPENTEGFIVRGISDVSPELREERLRALRSSYT